MKKLIFVALLLSTGCVKEYQNPIFKIGDKVEWNGITVPGSVMPMVVDSVYQRAALPGKSQTNWWFKTHEPNGQERNTIDYDLKPYK